MYEFKNAQPLYYVVCGDGTPILLISCTPPPPPLTAWLVKSRSLIFRRLGKQETLTLYF